MIRRQDVVEDLKELQKYVAETTATTVATTATTNTVQRKPVRESYQDMVRLLPIVQKKHHDLIHSTLDGDPEMALQQALVQIKWQAQLLLEQQGESTTTTTTTTTTTKLDYAQMVKELQQVSNDKNNNSGSSTNDDNHDNHHDNPSLRLLQAYGLYQLQDYRAVLELLEPDESVAALHLSAQALYQLQQQQQQPTTTTTTKQQQTATPHQILDLYHTLWEQTPDDPDIYVNAVAQLVAHATPYTNTTTKSNNNNNTNDDHTWIQTAAQEWLDNNNKTDDDDDTAADLATNLATLQLLTKNAGTARAILQKQKQDPNQSSSYSYDWCRHFWSGTMPNSSHNKTTTTTTGHYHKRRHHPLQALQTYQWMDTAAATAMTSTIKWTPLQQRLFHYNRCVALVRHADDAAEAAILHFWQQLVDNNSPLCVHHEDDDESLARLWWEVRLAVLQSYITSKSKTTATKKPAPRSLEALERVDLPSSFRDEILLYLQLHRRPASTLCELAPQLPPSMQSKPAVQATLVAQGQSDHGMYQAQYWYAQGQYEKAADLLETLVQNADNNDSAKRIRTAQWVQALTHVNPERAAQVWADFKQHWEPPRPDTDPALEQRPLPKTLSSSSVVHHPDDSTTTTVSKIAPKNKKSREAVLRQRARRREHYLASLPVTSSKPDPERWIPKYDRLAHRRRRHHHNNSNNNKQGAGRISERDAARLDVAARQANKGVFGPSTAHMAAAGSSGKRR